MSLINQMLQDLDKRGANPARGDTAYTPVAALPLTAVRSKWQWILALILMLLLSLAWLAWHQLRPVANAVPATAPLTTVKAIAVTPAPIAVSAPLAISAPKSLLHETEAALEDVSPISNLPVLLKLSSALDVRSAGSADVIEGGPKPYAQTSSAKPEKTNLSKPDASLANKSTAPQIQVKSTESSQPQAQPQMKLLKEATTHQQAEGEYRQATVLQQQGRTAEAISMLELALKIDAQHAAARQALISLLLESKRYDEAIRYLEQGLAQDQNQTGLAMILARLQVEKSTLSAAVDTLQRSLPYASERADYLAFLAALLQREARHKESIDLYQKALNKNPQNPVWWMGLGLSLQADARRAEALEAYRRAKSLTGLSPELIAFVEQKITQLQ
ncbi:tetratricopeptide repeat protein [Undibacterium sp. Ren11W]|uniref:tetratricopeptide repeat protein n=1 Tax=Undibacterium sp. Ren11W TaxID=3413045 RepID=UPI003BF396E8